MKMIEDFLYMRSVLLVVNDNIEIRISFESEKQE